MKKVLQAITGPGRILAVGFLAFVFLFTSLGFGFGFGLDRINAPKQQSPSAVSPQESEWGNMPPWPLEFAQVSAGATHNLGLTTDGDLYSWGENFAGQLGLGAEEEFLGSMDFFDEGIDQNIPHPIMYGTKFSQIAVGVSNSLAITTDGDLYSWGDPEYLFELMLNPGNPPEVDFSKAIPQPVDVSELPANTKFSQIAANMLHSLAITTAGELYSWGYNFEGQLGNGSADMFYYPTPQLIDLPGIQFSQIEAGSALSFAITQDGDLYAWGKNTNGELGFSGIDNQLTPQLVMSGTKFSHISAGDSHSLAITTDGDLYSWGDSWLGQLGHGVSGPGSGETPPQIIMPGTQFAHISAAQDHSFAITSGGDLYSWGSSYNGQLGIGTSGGVELYFDEGIDFSTPQLVMEGEGIEFLQVITSSYHSLAIAADGRLYSWGSNEYGQLGLGMFGIDIGLHSTPLLIATPPKPPLEIEFAKIAAGSTHSLAITADGDLYSWGDDQYGKLGLGIGVAENQHVPKPVDISHLPPGTKFSQIAADGDHSFAITQDGVLYAWGYNRSGQLGLDLSMGNIVSVHRPYPVFIDELPPGTKFSQISAGSGHCLALTTTGDIYSWGRNNSGELGLDNTITELIPQPVKLDGANGPGTGTKFSAISAGGGSSFAITTSGDLYSWGNNIYFKLGLGQIAGYQSTPQPVMSGTKFSIVSAGSGHTLAITIAGDPYSWGYNVDGQLGLGHGAAQQTPQPVKLDGPNGPGVGAKFSAIAAGNDFSLGLTTTGDLYSWGYNYFGQLGLGTNGEDAMQYTPQPVKQGTQFSAITVGYDYSLGLTTTGELYSWGSNEYGQLGLGKADLYPRTIPKLVAIPKWFQTITAFFTDISAANARVSSFASDCIPSASIELEVKADDEMSIIFDAGLGNTINFFAVVLSDDEYEIIDVLQLLENEQNQICIVKDYVILEVIIGKEGQQLTLLVTGVTADLIIAAETVNVWNVERFLNWPPGTGSAPAMSSVQVSESYVAATAAPTGEQIPAGKTFAGWFTQPVGGIRVDASMSVSSIGNWNSVERIDRIYAQWV